MPYRKQSQSSKGLSVNEVMFMLASFSDISLWSGNGTSLSNLLGEEVHAACTCIPFSHSHLHTLTLSPSHHPLTPSPPHPLTHTQDGSGERGEAGDQVDAQWGETGADWNHHTIRGTEGVRGPVHAVQWLHAPETVPGEWLV